MVISAALSSSRGFVKKSSPLITILVNKLSICTFGAPTFELAPAGRGGREEQRRADLRLGQQAGADDHAGGRDALHRVDADLGWFNSGHLRQPIKPTPRTDSPILYNQFSSVEP